ncbi:NAD(P)H-dependent oxidoreductase subunit E [Nanoarchaeota archaeon]
MGKVLLNVLREAQDKHGYLSEYVLKQISIEQNVPIARLYGMATFYTMLRIKPQGKYVIEICGSPSCVLNNGVTLEKFLEKQLRIKIGETTKDGLFSLYKVSCIGCCDEAPAALINGRPRKNLTVQNIKELIIELRKNANTKRNKT